MDRTFIRCPGTVTLPGSKKCSVDVFKYAFSTPTSSVHCAFTLTSYLKEPQALPQLRWVPPFCSWGCIQPCPCQSPSRVPRISWSLSKPWQVCHPSAFPSGLVSLFLALPQGRCYIKQLQLFLKIGLFCRVKGVRSNNDKL